VLTNQKQGTELSFYHLFYYTTLHSGFLDFHYTKI